MVTANVWATDSFGGNVYIVLSASVMTPNSALVWLNAPESTPPAGGFGANGIALLSDKLFVAVTASSTTGGSLLVSVDPYSATPASTLKVVNLTEGGAAAQLSGADGIEALGNRELLIVENGFIAPNKARLVKATLDTE